MFKSVHFLIHGMASTFFIELANAQELVVSGATITTTPLNSPEWNTGANTVIGSGGVGALEASGGQRINGTNFVFGDNNSDQGAGSLNGAGTTLNVTEQLNIGNRGKGTLNIKDGATVNNTKGGNIYPGEYYSVNIGKERGSHGILNITGTGSKLDSTGAGSVSGISVGHFGKGEMHLVDGAEATFGVMRIGTRNGSDGTVTLSGADTKLNVTDVDQWLIVGRSGTGRLAVENKAEVNVAGYMRVAEGNSRNSSPAIQGELEVLSGGSVNMHRHFGIAFFENTQGSAIIDGIDSSVRSGGTIQIGRGGRGTLTVSNSGRLYTPENIMLGSSQFDVGTGTINIGDGGLAGVVDTRRIFGLNENSSINFNHTGEIDFLPMMSGTIDVKKLSVGATSLMAENEYIGTTTVEMGILRAGNNRVFSVTSDHVIGGTGVLDLNGFNQTVRSLDNAGNVYINGAPGNTLTVDGNYIGNGGTLHINTALGDDASLTDRLIVKGDTSGSSFVQVTNAGGLGALTDQGIEVISVGGKSEGEFRLKQTDGTDYLVVDAYTYRLHQNNSSGTSPNDWYLRSFIATTDSTSSTKEYHVGSPAYEAYPQALLGLNGLSTLQQRVGNRFWTEAGNSVMAQGTNARKPYAQPEEAGAHINGNGIWGRIEGIHSSIDPRFSTTGTYYKQDALKLQTGIDGLLRKNEKGALIGGVFIQYVEGKTKTNSTHYAGSKISTDGYGLGGTLTWYGNEGFYIDGQAQVSRYNSDLTTSARRTPKLKSGNDGMGYALSVETGKRFAIDPIWSFTPQGQLVYSRVDFDDFTDTFGSRISLDRSRNLQGRVGLTLDHENSWLNKDSMVNRTHLYGITNLYYEFLEGTKVNIADMSFGSKKDRLLGGIGAGGSYNWNDDKYSIYAEGLVNSSLKNIGDSYSLMGSIGLRVQL